MTARASFKQADLERALSAARKVGFRNVRVTVNPRDGALDILASDDPGVTFPDRRNPLDRLLGQQ